MQKLNSYKIAFNRAIFMLKESSWGYLKGKELI